MINYCKYIHSRDKRVALYSGRDTYIEDWMNDALKKVDTAASQELGKYNIPGLK